MTTKPKARRFRLRLGDESTGALRTSVAPQRAEAARASGTPGASTSATSPATASPAAARTSTDRVSPTRGLADEGAARPSRSSARPAAAPTGRAANDALFDEAASGQTGAAPQGTSRAAAPESTAQAIARTMASPQSTSRASPRSAADADDSAAANSDEFTGRQLRMAMRVAQRNGIKADTGLDAVRLLRQQGIDPFERSTLLDIVRDEGSRSRALTTTDQPQLPKAYRQPPLPAKTEPPRPDVQRKAEISRIQHDIRRRRRRRILLLMARLGVFVTLPTLIAAWYFYFVATPLYATNSEFVIQQADSSSAGAGAAGALSGIMGGAVMGSNQDSITVQSYLQSRDAMRRLNAEEGFKAYFQDEAIDPIRRLPADSTDEAAYRLYQDMVQVSFDPTEGIIRMEVSAADPETSERFALALISYAEEVVDQLTQRLRENQMNDAQAGLEQAEARMNEAQYRVLELQERFQMLSSEVEVTLLTQQITNLETQLNQERLSLDDLRANARPNPARLEQAQRRVATLEQQVADLRGSLTQSSDGGPSVASLQREQVMAESDVATRQMLLAQAMQQLEAARIEANRQVRYLSLGVRPVAPDEPTYPRAAENTALAFLIFAGIYLLISMTTAILREQITG